MNNHEKLARITVEFDYIADCYKSLMDAVDACWHNLRDCEDCEDDVARIKLLAGELRKNLEELEGVCDAD